jgi:hypothetical protein
MMNPTFKLLCLLSVSLFTTPLVATDQIDFGRDVRINDLNRMQSWS